MKKILLITGLFVVAGVVFIAGQNKSESPVTYALSEREINKLETAKTSEVVELKDGDTYVIDATIVKQEVGNQTIKRLAYNGQIPGPILKAPRGSKVTIIHNNKTDEATALHSHGLRGESRYDGAAPLTQDPIKVGDSFTYELEFPDVGVYWYHPHVREDYAQEMGLYGNYIVEEENYWGSEASDKYLIFDDFDTDGVFTPDEETHTLMGRFGDKLLINDQENYQVNMEAGQIGRIFITNVANTRTFDIEFEGTDMKLVGGDNGRVQNESLIDNVILGTSERSIIEFLYDTPGTYAINHRGEKMGEVIVTESAKESQLSSFNNMRNSNGDYQTVIDNLDSFLAQEPDKKLRIDIEMRDQMADMMAMGVEEVERDGETVYKMMGLELNLEQALEHCGLMEMVGCEELIEENGEGESEEDDGIEWEDDMAMMNAMSNTENISWKLIDEATNEKPTMNDWNFNQGDFVKVQIYNDPSSMHPMQHPVHFHGQRFVVLTRDDEVNDNFQWKDSVLVPTGETVDILIEMTNVGDWMAHCHIAEHNAAGMMFNFKVN
ncbi:MAG: FtsP/CotA-like multicopper oxidase with cupredoxin domain [Candidatus Paceibacteria bacterium]|jgi:FtsP/CotA-like multicopper oxidase with cupredoxin domain